MTKNEKTTIIVTVIIWIIFGPLFVFWLGYFAGWIAKLWIGEYIVEFFALFNINLPIDKIPLFAGVLSWITSCFFKPVKVNSNN